MKEQKKNYLKVDVYMIGKILVYSAFVFSLISVITYLISVRKPKLAIVGRWSYYIVTGLVLAICMYLLSNILSHNFQFTYIWEYSSTELPTNLLIATFYAGQQGSFLLWTLMLTLIGYFLIPYSREKGYESYSIAIFSLILSFLFLILIFKSPFEYVWETYAGQEGVVEGFTPKNGRGLNPILQNYWINIHPPILFLGYSLMTVPYVFAMAGLFKNDNQRWINVALPWTLFGTGVLGLGLMLGGLWAYETLGWGGFWAWDPVENSSLIPWLVSLSLVHTMYVAKNTGGLIKTNYVLAFLSFIFVLYASFLTRSGVLGDTSVHSFVSPGPIVYKLLLYFLLAFILFAVVSLLTRLNKIKSKNIDFQFSSREFIVSLGAIIIMLITFIVVFGTSWPILTEILGMTKSTVDIHWYDDLNLPLAVIMMILNSYSILLSWKKTDISKIIKKVFYAIAFGLFAVLIGRFIGLDNLAYTLLAFSIGFTLFIHTEILVKTVLKNPKLTGAYLAHIGIAVLLLGAMISGGYSESKQISLKPNETAEFKGYELKLLGRERIEKRWTDKEKYRYDIEITKDGKTTSANPIVFWSDFNNRESPFFEPGIANYISKDLYIFPYSIQPYFEVSPSLLKKTETAKVSLDTNYKIQFLNFEMSAMRGMMSGESSESNTLKVGAIVRISNNNLVYEDTLYSNMDAQTMMIDPVWYEIRGTELEVGFMQIMPDEKINDSKAVFAYKEKGGELSQPSEIFTFEISTKPFINLVWIGTLLLVIGFFISIVKYITPKSKT